MNGFVQQLGEEIAARAGIVSLLEPSLARRVLEDIGTSARRMGVLLGDDEAAGRCGADVVSALWPASLWPDGPPVEWWFTPLGRRLVRTGHDPKIDDLSQRHAASLLGWTRHRVGKELGAGPFTVAELVAVADA